MHGLEITFVLVFSLEEGGGRHGGGRGGGDLAHSFSKRMVYSIMAVVEERMS